MKNGKEGGDSNPPIRCYATTAAQLSLGLEVLNYYLTLFIFNGLSVPSWVGINSKKISMMKQRKEGGNMFKTTLQSVSSNLIDSIYYWFLNFVNTDFRVTKERKESVNKTTEKEENWQILQIRWSAYESK